MAISSDAVGRIFHGPGGSRRDAKRTRHHSKSFHVSSTPPPSLLEVFPMRAKFKICPFLDSSHTTVSSSTDITFAETIFLARFYGDERIGPY
ncbi:hypothetical protein AVEN_156808-1 [Araneus ventricosus]|uniref:Uncharacterized protein n=1 Tax=Araneus ventricosus TaxID=182803 RepID=A0A4Y2WD23_ARAVE|nr:hypothetical protein AVEN_156808-1 [Araneus ventricosus]